MSASVVLDLSDFIERSVMPRWRTIYQQNLTLIRVNILKTYHLFLSVIFQEGEKFPVVHLHLTKSSDDFVQYTSELEYEAMMEFITDNTK